MLVQPVQPRLIMLASVVIANDGGIRSIRLLYETNVVSRRADVLSAHDDICLFRSFVTVVSKEVLRLFVDLDILVTHLSQRLNQTFLVLKLSGLLTVCANIVTLPF